MVTRKIHLSRIPECKREPQIKSLCFTRKAFLDSISNIMRTVLMVSTEMILQIGQKAAPLGNPFELDLFDLLHADYYGYDLAFAEGMTLEACRNGCPKNCRCKGFGYALNGGGKCYQKSTHLDGNRMAFF
ncbi:hypothetical protein RJ639_028779 [Escallonia herrerae]|uniref:Apple domain-containing protein n=1 Tax=Escallonia herrerae TaxID=1293975 RepID=A0AA88X6P3_9ASTE|nr:hypothetical protein RJ639_028779 [Escallonia herrerae]